MDGIDDGYNPDGHADDSQKGTLELDNYNSYELPQNVTPVNGSIGGGAAAGEEIFYNPVEESYQLVLEEPADGDCFYNAVIDSAKNNEVIRARFLEQFGDQGGLDASILRNSIAEIIRQGQDFLDDEVFKNLGEQLGRENYAASISSGRLWGGHPEMQIIADFCQVAITNLDRNNPNKIHTNITPGDNNSTEQQPSLYLLYSGSHYDACLSFNNPGNDEDTVSSGAKVDNIISKGGESLELELEKLSNFQGLPH
jgi:hypothetical protein